MHKTVVLLANGKCYVWFINLWMTDHVHCNCNTYAEACPFLSVFEWNESFWTVNITCVCWIFAMQCNVMQLRLYVFLGGNWRDLSPHTLSAHTPQTQDACKVHCTLCFVYFSICRFVFHLCKLLRCKVRFIWNIYKCAHAFCLHRAHCNMFMIVVVLRCCAFVFISMNVVCAFRVLITIVGVCCSQE